MTDPYKSLDDTIAAIRDDCEARLRACEDRTLAAEVKATFLSEQLEKANQARIAAERITMALITQFSTVERVFADAKQLALSVEAQPQPTAQPQPAPVTPEPQTRPDPTSPESTHDAVAEALKSAVPEAPKP